MLGLEVSPASIRKGDTIATKFKTFIDDETGQELHRIIHSRKVKDVKFCPTQPEFFHLDGDCYDTRFKTVVRAIEGD